MAPDRALLTTSEVATMLHVGPSTVRRWVERGDMAAVHLPSGQLRFRRADVVAMLAPTDEAAS